MVRFCTIKLTLYGLRVLEVHSANSDENFKVGAENLELICISTQEQGQHNTVFPHRSASLTKKRICESCVLRLSDPHFFGHGGQTFVLSLWKNIARPGTEALYKSRSDTREGFAHFGASVKGKRSHTGPAVAEF